MEPIVIPHRLDASRVKAAAERIASDLQFQYGGDWEWVADHALQFRHRLIAGTLAVYTDRLEIAINLGPSLSFFADRLRQHLTLEASRRLEEMVER